MNTLEKIEWLDKNIEKVRSIFSEAVIEGVRQGLWEIYMKEQKEDAGNDEASITDEQVEFNKQAILNK